MIVNFISKKVSPNFKIFFINKNKKNLNYHNISSNSEIKKNIINSLSKRNFNGNLGEICHIETAGLKNSFNTVFINCKLIGRALAKDKPSIEFENEVIFSYERSMFFNIYSIFFSLISICLSEKFFVKITLIISSVGRLIPISTKLLSLDFKSSNLVSDPFKEA